MPFKGSNERRARYEHIHSKLFRSTLTLHYIETSTHTHTHTHTYTDMTIVVGTMTLRIPCGDLLIWEICRQRKAADSG